MGLTLNLSAMPSFNQYDFFPGFLRVNVQQFTWDDNFSARNSHRGLKQEHGTTYTLNLVISKPPSSPEGVLPGTKREGSPTKKVPFSG